MNILVIDDSEAAQIAFEQVLTHAGYAVTTAGTAEEGLQSIRRKTPDLIVLDVQLPDLLGTQLCEMLKKDPATRFIPILMCTGRKDVVHGLNLGADDYMVKPCGKDEMIARVNALLRRVELAEERAREREKLKQQQKAEAQRHAAAAPRKEHARAPAASTAEKLRRGLVFAWRSLAYPLQSPSKAEEVPLAAAMTPLWILCLSETAVRLAGPHAESWLRAALSGFAGPLALWAATVLLSFALLSSAPAKNSRSNLARICAAAAAPLALRGLLALLYVLLCDGVPGEFTVGPLLLPGGPALGPFLAHLDFFALWSALIVAVGARRVGKLSKPRAFLAGGGAFALWVLAQVVGRFAVWGS